MPSRSPELILVDGQAVIQWLEKESKGALNDVLDKFPGDSAWGVGGTILSCFIGKPLRDLDIAVETDKTPAEIQSLFGDGKVNSFGGLHIKVAGLPVDIWAVKNTFELKPENRFKPDIEDLLATLPYNIDKIAVELRSGRVCDQGCIEGIRSRTIEYSTRRRSKLHVEAARAIALRYKTGFRFGSSAIELIEKVRTLLQDTPSLWDEMARSLDYKHPDVLREAELVFK